MMSEVPFKERYRENNAVLERCENISILEQCGAMEGLDAFCDITRRPAHTQAARWEDHNG